jgi:hypothetical protein
MPSISRFPAFARFGHLDGMARPHCKLHAYCMVQRRCVVDCNPPVLPAASGILITLGVI